MDGLAPFAFLGGCQCRWTAVVNVAFWLAVFGGGAAWRFGRHTAPV
jgi:hypothetical protein